MTDILGNPERKVLPFPQTPGRAREVSVGVSGHTAVVLRPVFGIHRRVDGSGGPQGDTLPFAMDPERLLSGLGLGYGGPTEVRWTPRLTHLHSIVLKIPIMQAGRLANPQETKAYEYRLAAGVMPDERIAETILSASEEELYNNGAYYAPLAEELLRRVIHDRISAL